MKIYFDGKEYTVPKTSPYYENGCFVAGYAEKFIKNNGLSVTKFKNQLQERDRKLEKVLSKIKR
jgi:hypothetical protein